MSKTDLLGLYNATAAEKDELAAKYGQYLCFSRQNQPNIDNVTRGTLPRLREGP